jgi:hypothetical protein
MGKAEQRRETFALLVTQAGSSARKVLVHLRVVTREPAVSVLSATAPPASPLALPADTPRVSRWAMLANLVARVFYPAKPTADWTRCLYCEAPPTHPGSPAGRGQPIRWVPMCQPCALEHGDYWTRERAR